MAVMTKDELADQIRYELARRFYKQYFLLSNPGYKIMPHINLIMDKLQKIIDGEQHYYIFEMPPRHGKSATISETFPSYFISKNPDKEVMMVSYSAELSLDFGRKNRRKFSEMADKIFGLKVSRSQGSVKEWGPEGHKGRVMSTSITGGATGRGADLLIIDDPVKNEQDASSSVIRERIWSEWQSTFSTRLHPGSSVIVIMTRWHEDDLVGRLLREKSYPWEEIRLPAVAEDDDDLLGRSEGEPLAPQLGWNAEWATKQKLRVGSRTWAALYQQRPTPQAGTVIRRDWIHYYVDSEATRQNLGLSRDVKIMPKRWDKQVQSWDATFKDAQTSDYVAGTVWGTNGAEFYLIDTHHERMDFPTTIKAINAMSDRYPMARAKYIEDKANGSAVIATLKNKLSGIVPVTPNGGKEVRLNAVAPLFEAGNVFVPHPSWKPEYGDYVTELLGFPYAPHDDWVDSTSQALSHIGNRGNLKDRFGLN